MSTPNKRKSSTDHRGNETPEKKKLIMVKKQSPRKSRAKFIWFKCVACLKKSRSDSKYCQNVGCSGKMTPIDSNVNFLGVYELEENIFSVRRNLSGHPVRCFVNKETMSCSFCTSFSDCIHMQAITKGEIVV